MSVRESIGFAILGAVAVIVLLMLVGCRSGSTFVEGTRFRMGVYIPYDGQLYGLQFCEYLNGTALMTPSNSAIKVERKYAETNDYLGVVHTRDSVHTQAETR